MKKILALFLVVTLIIPSAVVVAADGGQYYFDDVTYRDYYGLAAKTLYEAGVVSGYSDNTFGAERNVTRAEMATLICRILGEEAVAKEYTGFENGFSDVPGSHWASGYVYLASYKGIINGYGDGIFMPENNVRFEEAVKMVVCAAGLKHRVKDNPNDWAQGYIDVANNEYFTEKVKCSRGDYINRGDIAVMLYAAFQNKLHKVAFMYNKNEVSIENAPETTKTYLENSIILLNATPKNGYKFVKWELDGHGKFADEYSPSTIFTVSGGYASIKAVCEKTDGAYQEDEEENNYIEYDENGNRLKYQLTITMTGCGGIRDTSGKYGAGENVPIYILPGTETAFIKWTTTAGKLLDPTDPTGIITMPNEDVTVCAVFTEDGNPPKAEETQTPSTPSTEDAYADFLKRSEAMDKIDESITNESELYEMEQELLRLVNEERQKAGLKKLYWHGSVALRNAAIEHCKDMHVRNFFDHTNPDGETPADRIERHGLYSFRTAGENIAKGQTSPEEVMEDWMNSPGHRANILSEDFHYIGIGIIPYNGVYIWTQCFIGM